MKILLATTVNSLAKKFAVLSPELEYCAIVVDEVKTAEKILEQFNLSNVPLYPMEKLETCVESLDYDYLLYIQNLNGTEDLKITRKIEKCNFPKCKFLNFSFLQKIMVNFKTDHLLKCFKEHYQEFEMFATGISHAATGIDTSKFKRKLINFAKPSQDLYYDFQIAKTVVLYGGGIVRFVVP